MKTYKSGEPTTLRQLLAGSYFFHEEKLYVKSPTTKDRATFHLCHPVAGGEFGEVIQVGINAWLPTGTEITVAQVSIES